jgi:hypothetical protein
LVVAIGCAAISEALPYLRRLFPLFLLISDAIDELV